MLVGSTVMGEPTYATGLFNLMWPTFGDVGYRSSNFYSEGYNYVGGWVESRFTLQCLNGPAWHGGIGIYLKGVLAKSSHDESLWENTVAYGIGAEIRPLSTIERVRNHPWLEWLAHFRIYGEYLKHDFLGNEAEWFPDEDVRTGAEIWKEFNVDLTSVAMVPPHFHHRLWGELWWDGSYRRTNFFDEDYDSWRTAVVARFGLRLSPDIGMGRDIYLMPYVLAEGSLSQQRCFWENRGVVGLGLRVMPFQHAQTDWLNELRVFAEYHRVACYFKNDAPELIPGNDTRLGLNFSNSWW
jgi:hypothetical protein